MKKTEELRKIKTAVLSCKKCPLYQGRICPVIGKGNHQAKIMLVGEAPGFNEDRSGHPFCGAAGKILDELLSSVRIKREQIYITNVLKCRPPGNRDPLPEEIKACASYLERQIEIIRPKVICPLGRHSMKFLLERFGLPDQIEGISKIHGSLFESQKFFPGIKIIPLYHPAVAIYNPKMLNMLKKDFQILERYRG
jgi:DNA polymerase